MPPGLRSRRRMSVTDTELSSLAASHDIISLGVLADQVRRRRRGTRTTFVRVAMVSAEPAAAMDWPAPAGEIRIAGIPANRAAAVRRVGEVVASSNAIPVSAFSLADLEQMA